MTPTTPSQADIKRKIDDAAATVPGASIDISDDEKVSAKLEKERTQVLDNNQRDNDM